MMQRVKGLDFLRGIAILFMIFFHNLQFYSGDLDTLADSYANNPFAVIIKFLGRWAGLFVIISGFAHAMSIYTKMSEKEIKSHQIVKQTIVSGSWLIIMGRLSNFFFARTRQGGGIYGYKEGPYHYSLIVGTLETGQVQIPDMYSFIHHLGALDMLGFSLILYGPFLAILFRKRGKRKELRNFIILGILAFFFIGFSPLFKPILRPIWIKNLEMNHNLRAFLIGIWIGDTHPLIPFLGYAFIGNMFGYAYKLNVSPKKVNILGGIAASGFIVSGSIQYAILGEPPLQTINQTIPLRTTHLQIGIIMYLLLIIYTYEKKTINTELYNSKIGLFISRFGYASLTIFLLEGFLGSILKLIFLDTIVPNWATSMFWVVIYDLALISIWNFILQLWREHEMKYSFEWLSDQVMRYWLGKSKSHPPIPLQSEKTHPLNKKK